jgi:hypothetical protein
MGKAAIYRCFQAAILITALPAVKVETCQVFS